MKFDVTFTDGYGCYVVTTQDGRAALVNTNNYRTAWSDTVEQFLRFGPYHQVEEEIPAETMRLLDDLLDDRLETMELDSADMAQAIRARFGDAIIEEDC